MIAIWRTALIAVACLAIATQALAHREGESYVYLRVAEDGMGGEFHIRLSDLDKAVPMDADGDGRVSPEEYDAKAEEVQAHLAQALLIDANGPRRPAFVSRRFFAEGDPQVALAFELPGVGSPPDEIGVEYRFLYDGADPAHRPMLLFSSNTRMKLEENEAAVSLVFGPGEERQTLSLLPRPRSEIMRSFVPIGAKEVLESPQRLAFAIALFLPAVMTPRGGRWRPRESVAGAAVAAGSDAAGFALGLCGMVYALFASGAEPGGWIAAAGPALSAVLLAADNFRPFAGRARPALAVALGALQGVGAIRFEDYLGIEKGFGASALAGFGAGVWLGLILVAAVAAPGLMMLRRSALYETVALRLGSAAIALAAVAWFVRRTLA